MDNVLQPAHGKMLNEVIRHCNSARPHLEWLRGIGYPDVECEERMQHMIDTATRGLTLAGMPLTDSPKAKR